MHSPFMNPLKTDLLCAVVLCRYFNVIVGLINNLIFFKYITIVMFVDLSIEKFHI